MRIQLSGLSTEPQTFRHRCAAETYLDDKETFPGEITILATIGREGNSLHLSLEAELPAHFICDRCGKSFDREHHCRDDVYFTFEEDEVMAGDEWAHVIPKGITDLDISQEIRDMVILGLPVQMLCSEDCLGICPKCGVDLNRKTCTCRRESIDPRWEALIELKKKNRTET